MKILLIDTCGATGSLALADTARSPAVTASANLPGRSAAERLVPAIHSLAESSGITLKELDAVAVVHGPGSFTGVRVGLSAAKGLCHALNLPLVAISRLAVLAEQGASHSLQLHGDGWENRTHALLDAGRGEFYLGLYADGVCLREALVTRDQLFAGESSKRQPILIVCEPVVTQSLAALAPQLVAEPTAADALPLALARIQQRAFDDPATIDANYLRRSDAEIFAKPIAASVPQPLPTRSAKPAR
ncbi:MAG: tRNA (adenosine(37)-N6)-threonylcarbamoyltransferase complex dimerization subunit type 1 TsaB [Acidobacteriaceae bacterium]